MIQWYPGHMAKAFREIKEIAPAIDIFIIVLDARAPLASYNEEFDKIDPHKPRLFVLNKIDLSDQNKIKNIMHKFNDEKDKAITTNLKSNQDFKKIIKEANKLLEPKRAREFKKGILKPRLNAAVLGVPNSGKSTLINKIARKQKTKVGNKPGVTRGKQWIAAGNMQLLDTPGVLWPKFEKEEVGVKLTIIGSIKLSVLPLKEIFYLSYKMLSKSYPNLIKKLDLAPELEDTKIIYNNLYKLCSDKKFIINKSQIDEIKGMTYFMNYLRDLKGVTYD